LLCVAGLALEGRKVAVFGCGDQHGYGDYFCDAMEELYSSFKAAGCDMVGSWPTEGYEHSDSKVCPHLVSGPKQLVGVGVVEG
jgi:flavodoxin